MSLTTPVMPQRDSSFSSEGWFLYWKVSYGLWESKLRSYQGKGPIFVPVYWGLHTESGERPDFGESRPETQINRILEIAHQLHLPVVLLFPLGPVPFLPNGGLPPLLARHPAISPWGLSWAMAGGDEQINHLYSFFDPRIYKAYRSFAFSLAHYLRRFQGNSIQVLGLKSGCFHNGQFVSYFEDRGQAFEQGLKRFVEMKKEGKSQSEELAPEQLVAHEMRLRTEYAKMIKDLYLESAREAFGSSWLGAKSVGFLGGRPQDLPMMSSSFSDFPGRYFPLVQEGIQQGVISSSLLLNAEISKGVLERALHSQMSRSYVFEGLDPELAEDYSHTTLLPLDLIELDAQVPSIQSLEKSGLVSFLKERFGTAYRIETGERSNLHLESSYEEAAEGKLLFMAGDHSISPTLKWVLAGNSAMLETSSLSPAGVRRLELFLQENKLHEQVLMVQEVKIRLWRLGQGQLILLPLVDVLRLTGEEKNKFWAQIFSGIGPQPIQVDSPPEVFSFWQKRAPSGNELKYHEIRRLGLFNPSSYKKQVKINIPRSFALAKILDPINSQVQHQGTSIQVELQPQGSVTVEYGKFD